LLLEQPPRGHVLARLVAQAEFHARAAEGQVGLTKAEQIGRHTARFRSAADVAESERQLAAAAVGDDQFLEDGLGAQESVPQADMALAGDGAAVSKHAINADAFE